MKIICTYQEVSGLIQKKMNRRIELSYIDESTVKLSKEVKLPLFGIKTFGINLTIIGFEGNDLCLKMESDVISKLVGLIKGLDTKKFADISGDRITVHLDAFEEGKKVLELMEPKTIRFIEEGIEIAMELKY